MKSITPLGYFREFLLNQKNGLTGNIEKAGYPFNEVEWGDNKILTKLGPAWWAYEQTGYWLDGFTRCAILLEDADMLSRAKQIIYNVINNADCDGYLGPDFLKSCDKNGENRIARWPHVIFFRACMALYEYTNDKSIIDAMERHYLGHDYTDYCWHRNIYNIEIMLWLYSKTKNKNLLDLSIEFYEGYQNIPQNPQNPCDEVALSEKKPHCHGVSYNEYFKLGAILYLYTNNKKYLNVSVNAYKKIDKYFLLIDGLHSANEYTTTNSLMESHETCNISDYTWSLFYLYKATKNTDYLEKIEKCIFNAGLGSIDNDFKALQYLSSVNQVLCTDNSESSSSGYRGGNAAKYSPNPSTACCPGNVNRFMPNYILNMWDNNEKGIFLNLFGASKVSYDECVIKETTQFPYDNTITLDITCKKPFDLFIRLPKWANNALIDQEAVETKHGGYYKKSITENTKIKIKFITVPTVRTRKNYAYVTNGLLLYSFAVPSEYKKRGDADFPTYSITPNGTWNYGIKKDSTLKAENNCIFVNGYIVDNWRLKKYKSTTRNLENGTKQKIKGDFVFTPPIPKKIRTDGVAHKIKLIPYADTMTRVTAFPIIKDKNI